MAKIAILPPQEAQKIAAGEVVERPANIVKELVENALDAGATYIKLICTDGGRQSIRIIDNGQGMDEQDAQLCFVHHATSKIKSVDDLNAISTFGFRGEALSSIASVSKVTLITKEEAAESGTRVVLEGGIVSNQAPISATTGTDITINDLFYNVPARRKFLKSRDTEWRHIMLFMQACCLGNIKLHVEIVHDGITVLHCPAADTLRTRALQLWEANVAQQILDFESDPNDKGIHLSGFISNHQYYTYDRSRIYIFANNRWVKNQHISKAILKGYQNVLQPGCFPMACLFISVDAHELDINTHPRKEEVIFLHPKRVETLITSTVQKTLEAHISRYLAPTSQTQPAQKESFIIPSAPFAPQTGYTSDSRQQPFFKIEHQEVHTTPPFTRSTQLHEPMTPQQSQEVSQPDSRIKQVPMAPQTTVFTQKEQAHYSLIGQLRKTYILIEQDEHLILIDQHAAHERILYEQFTQAFENIATIKLLFPTIITLKTEDIQLLEQHIHMLSAYGIKADIFSAQSIIVTETPVTLKQAPLDGLINQFINWIGEFYQNDESGAWRNSIHDKMRAHMACIAAVKAGDQLTIEQMQQLLHDIFVAPNKLTCPHGRPTMWIASADEIDKKFKRDYRQARNTE